ncbi:hypothetical protein [Chondromyces apiculatus]|uniref:Uncharacterized protein n=1 Tax=Chondromyces apiculatus DSM 436 TaxID=1192034 RepID=A0A017TCA7_9BACT|nr:hypothetical protein [Chondromyces apiculatus]EYF06918.1 Hypothetical protein CAP_1176 [Chondromyces apiculatus DSM 436]
MSDEEREPGLRQEADKVPMGQVLLLAFAMVGIAGVMVMASALLLGSSLDALRPSRVWPEARQERRAFPVIQQEPFGETGPGQALERKKRAEMGAFRWVDREGGRVGVPIDVAMDLVVEESQR